MIRTMNAGMQEAVEVLREMSLGKSVRYWYEMRLKMRRDRKAEDDYVRECGKAEGKAEAILSLLGEYGRVPDRLREGILSEKNPAALDRWLKTAAKAESIRQFCEDCAIPWGGDDPQ